MDYSAQIDTTHYSASDTAAFVVAHSTDDVAELALHRHRFPTVDFDFALTQIAGRRVASRKVPLWEQCDGIVYPPRLSLEQCSSQITAAYKAPLATGRSIADLTAGMGVDLWMMARGKSRVIAVERNPHLCELLRHNLPLMGVENLEVINGTAEDVLDTMPQVDCIFLDPARRDSVGKRVFGIADCSPNVAVLAPALLSKAPTVIVKLSPMLDISATVAALPAVSEVHIISVSGECKEILVVLSRNFVGSPRVVCASDDSRFSFTAGDTTDYPPFWDEVQPVNYLYEPNASIMKAGCFAQVAQHYSVTPLSASSHLMVSATCVASFPGRAMKINKITSLNKKELKVALGGITQANITTRNFPMRPEQLASRLRLRDGGDTYIFATTTVTGKHLLFICTR